MSEPVPESGSSPVPRRSARWLLSLLVVTAAAVAATYLINRSIQGDALTDQGSLRILTWNIGKLYHARWDSRASDDDLEHVAQVIRQTDADVVALQELKGPTQLGRLVSILGRRWRAQAPEDVYDRRAGLLTRLPVKFVKLPTSSGRVAQGAVVTLRRGGELAVASVHLDAFDPDRRLRQAEEIVAGVRRLGVPDLLIAGDFNFDASVVAQDSADQRLYRFLTQEMVDAAQYAGATSVISRRLDYVFYRGSRVKKTDAEVLHNKRINIMDHDPLLVELRLAKPRRR